MNQSTNPVRLILFVAMIALAGLVLSLPAQATADPLSPGQINAVDIKFRVTIELVRATSNFDGDPFFDKADFYPEVAIADRDLSNYYNYPAVLNTTELRPDWQFEYNVPVEDPLNDSIPIVINILDLEDLWTGGGSTVADLTPDANKGLHLEIDVNDCLAGNPGAIGGPVRPVTARCGHTLFSSGTDTHNTALIWFRIDAELIPSASNLHVRCLHEPIWPQPGETVTVSAQALDDNLQPVDVVNEVSVWINDINNPANRCLLNGTCSGDVTSPANTESLFYGCQVKDGDQEVWSGWRRVQSGDPPTPVIPVIYHNSAPVIPVIYHGNAPNIVDIVFYPDQISYDSPDDPRFLTDVRDMIYSAYYGGDHDTFSPISAWGPDSAYGERLFLKYQSRFNFWISKEMGQIEVDHDLSCRRILSPRGVYGFAELGTVLHNGIYAGCGRHGDRLFAAPRQQFRAIIHETLHTAFLESDEHCCDGLYQELPFVNDTNNIYRSLPFCQEFVHVFQEYDALLGDPIRSTGACRNLPHRTDPTVFAGWFTSDPLGDGGDIMFDGGEFNGADVLRVEQRFNICVGEPCYQPGSTPGTLVNLSGPRTDPVPEIEYAAPSKVVALNLEFNTRTDVVLESVSAGHDVLPMNAANEQSLGIDLLDAHDQLIGHLDNFHPLIQTGVLYLKCSSDPKALSCAYFHSPSEWLEGGARQLYLPFLPNLAAVRLTDNELQQTLATFDVTPALDEFCAANTGDEDCQIRAHGNLTSRLVLPAIFNASLN